MSNGFTTPPVLPDSSSVVAGQTIATTTLNRMGDLSNYMDAHGGSTNVISQSYDDDVFIMDSSSTPATPNSSWQFPTISSKHLELVVYVVAKCTVGTATVDLDLTIGATTLSTVINVNASAYATYSSTITASSIAVTFAQLDLTLTSSASGIARIRTVMARWNPLSDPIDAGESTLGTIYPCVPFGTARLGASQALTSRAGHQFLSNIDHFRQRPRMLISWAGLFNTSPVTTSTSPPRVLGFGDVAVLNTLAPWFSFLDPSTYQFTLAFKISSGAPPLVLNILGNRIVTSGTGWRTGTYTIESDISNQSEFFNQDLLRFGFGSTASNGGCLAFPANDGYLESFNLWSC